MSEAEMKRLATAGTSKWLRKWAETAPAGPLLAPTLSHGPACVQNLPKSVSRGGNVGSKGAGDPSG